MFRRVLTAVAISLTALVATAPAAVASSPSTSVGPVTLNGLPGCC
jgi:hypothetical protein